MKKQVTYIKLKYSTLFQSSESKRIFFSFLITCLSITFIIAQENNFIKNNLSTQNLKTSSLLALVTDNKTKKSIPLLSGKILNQINETQLFKSDSNGYFKMSSDTNDFDLNKIKVVFDDETYRLDTLIYSPENSNFQILFMVEFIGVSTVGMKNASTKCGHRKDFYYFDGVKVNKRKYQRMMRKFNLDK